MLESSTGTTAYTAVITVTVSYWTAVLTPGSYSFEVVASAGTHWASAPSTPTILRSIFARHKCR